MSSISGDNPGGDGGGILRRKAAVGAVAIVVVVGAVTVSRPGAGSGIPRSATSGGCGTSAVAASDANADIPEIKPDVYLLSAPEGNTLVVLGKDGPVVIGRPVEALMGRVCQFLAMRHAGRPRYTIIVDGDSAIAHGDGGWSRAGAISIAQENIRTKVRWAVRSDSGVASVLPTIGFDHVVQLAVDNDEIHSIHEPGGYSDADMIVHFEERHFIYLGNMFTNDGYPAIDVERGGSITGLIRSADKFLGMWSDEPTFVEPVIPGRGPIAKLSDLKRFRDMLASVRDTVEKRIQAGENVDQVVAARPTSAFDARWGRGPVSPEAFVRLVYASISHDKNARAKGGGH